MLPYARQDIEQDDIDAVVAVLRSDRITQGPVVVEFEKAVANLVGVSHAVAVSSGTAALCAMLPEFHGGEVITTPLTFAATAAAIVCRGGVPAFADVEENTLLLDPRAVQAAITPRTVGILPVDYTGQPCDYKALADFGLPVWADAAHSFGGAYGGRPVGQLARATILSFHPVKTITTGEGGMVLTDDDEVAARARRYRDHGRLDGNVVEIGYNFRMCEMQAALGLSQLSKLDRFVARRNAIAVQYDAAFRDRIGHVRVCDLRHSARHLYVVRVANRDEFRARLAERGIGTQVHYPLVYRHGHFARWRRACPIGERAAGEIVSLPCYPSLSDADVERVIAATLEFAA